MQSYMQSDKATKMQSHVDSGRVNEIQYNDMQNEMQFDMQFCRSDEIFRAYKARPRDGTLGTNPSTSHKMSKKEIKDSSTRYPRASTPSDIDLPSSGVQTESNSISQVFFYDKGATFPLKNDILVLSTVQGISDCSQLVYGNDDLVTDLAFHVDDVQASPPSGQPQIDILERTEKVASNANSLMKGKKIPVSGKKEKKKKGSTTTRVRRRNTSRNKSEEVRLRGHIKRPQHQVLGFMEDHAEFGSDWSEASECRGRYMSSVLESTVDGSIIKGARRVNNSRRMTSAKLTSCIDSAVQVGDVDEDPLNTLDDWGLKSEFHKYKCSCCEEISHHRADIECHIAGLGATHSDAVVVVLLGDKAQGRNCSLCNIRLQRKEYFKHIREKHKEVFSLRCGYCPFLGHDHNQMRHHIQKKHRTTKYEIIDMSHSQVGKDNAGSKLPASDIDAMSDEEETEEDSSNSQPMTCPLCGKSLKTLRNLKRHVMQHSRQKKQCNLCSFTTNFPTQIRSHYQRKHPTETPKWKKIVVARGGSDALVEDATPYLKMVSAKYGVRKPKIKKWMRQYRCPHCDYTCNFNSSYNRHLRVHKGLKPFKCGYCSFHGREAYVVNNHCSKVHKGKEIIVEKDKNFKAPYRYAKKMKKERFEWDELVDVVENEVNHLAAKPSSDTLQPDIKVEVQTEASSEVNVMKSKSNNRNRLKGKTSEASMYKCLVISTGKNMNDCLESTGETIQVEIGTEKAGSERLSLTNTNNNLGKTETEKSICETPLPSIRWDEGEESLKQNINLLLDDNSTTNNLTRPHRKGRSFTENREIFIDEAISRVVPMKSHLIEGKNQSLQDEESMVCSSSSLNKSPSTIKVKTFRDSIASSLGCPTEDRSLLDESSLSNMQFPGDTIGALSTADIISSCIVSDSTLDNLSDETVVIQLYANENCTPKAVTTYNSIDGLEDGCVFDQKSCKVGEFDINLPLKVTASEPVSIQSSDTSNNTLPQNAPKENDIPELKCYEFVKTVDNHDDRSTFKVEEPSSVPPQGLENTLHSHITFLSDSLAHRLSNRISAPPGVMTRDLLGLDYSNSDYFSSEKVRMMMKKKKGGRVKCLECGVTTTCRAFYKHAKKHFNIKPFKCGYCTYRSIEKSKIRVHNAFCHPHKPCIILKLSPETAGVDNNASNLLSNKPVTSTPKHILETKNCASEGNELVYTGTNLLKNTKCSELEIMNNNLRKEDKTTSSSAAAGLTSKIAVFQCPICSKILKNHTPSIRRHLYSHYSYKPYKCGYCTFTAIGQTEIRAHHVTHGSINAPKIEQSGAPMPFGLTQYIDELLSQQRGNKRVYRKKEQGNNQTEVKITKNPTDIMWHEPEASREDLTSMYLSTEDPSQGLVTDDQHELEALGVEACSLQQSLESVEFNAETTYAVQVLETDRQSSSSFSSDLPPQLDLNVGTNSSSDVTGDPVCVVYLFE